MHTWTISVRRCVTAERTLRTALLSVRVNNIPLQMIFFYKQIYLFSSFRSDLEDLSVKQLKEILMLNRVDYKGCCEKNELIDRVYRLWIDYKTCPCKSYIIK